MLQIEHDVPLAPLTTLGVGGPARWFVRVTSVEALREADRWATTRGVPLIVLGGGSNVVVADAGVDGLVVHLGLKGLAFEPEGETTDMVAAAGETWDAVVAASVDRDLAGLEALSGIPGTVGGAPIQNVGAYGQDVAGVIRSVTVYDRTDHAVRTLPVEACAFGYRTSRFKREAPGRVVVCAVRFRLAVGPPTVTYPDVRVWLAERGVARPTVREVRQAVLEVRARKGMVLDARDTDTRSVGSFFVNPVLAPAEVSSLEALLGTKVPGYPAGNGLLKVPAAWLVERAGCGRGYGEGAVGLSTKHVLAIVNRGGATAEAVLARAMDVRQRVLERTGIELQAEPVFVGFGQDQRVAALKAATA